MFRNCRNLFFNEHNIRMKFFRHRTSSIFIFDKILIFAIKALERFAIGQKANLKQRDYSIAQNIHLMSPQEIVGRSPTCFMHLCIDLYECLYNNIQSELLSAVVTLNNKALDHYEITSLSATSGAKG